MKIAEDDAEESDVVAGNDDWLWQKDAECATLHRAATLEIHRTFHVREIPNNRVTRPQNEALAEIGALAPKRLLDIIGSIGLGLLTSPILIVAAVGIRLTSKGSILYRHERIGQGYRPFTALKFRTMRMNADERLDDCLQNDTALREQWKSVNKLKKDPRVTPVGRILRRFSLDELPQLWNVFVGDMSLIGPRPIVAGEIEKYGSQCVTYACVRPGLTGLWQVSGRNDTTYEERVAYDTYYVHNWSLWLDAKIFFRTFRAVVSGEGAY